MSLKQAFNYEIFYGSPEVTINTKNIYTSYTQKKEKRILKISVPKNQQNTK